MYRTGTTEIWFAQVRAFVTCKNSAGIRQEMALVAWYEVVDVLPEEEFLGMQKVIPEVIKGRRRYDVVSIRSIEKDVFLQPHPTEADTFFYSHFV